MYHFKSYRKTDVFLRAILFLLVTAVTIPTQAQAAEQCPTKDRSCVLEQMITNAADIDNTAWKDQTYREIVKTLAFEGNFDRALVIFDLIETPDTKAMTIRGIGMTLANYKDSPEELTKKFAKLRVKADSIMHPPSRGIALTYIAMSQAFAGDNEGAWKTTEDMKNAALQHKAYGETAEIQAEKGDFKSAKISIDKIESLSFRNKAYETISKILSDNKQYEDAYSAANAITNAYKKGQAIQYLLDQQKPRERIQQP
tara:strand:+ start:8913 stop:9680 length:768 start_codon:yes stop_codon:yes gene_type:complete